MGVNGKSKGSRYELKVGKKICELWGYDYGSDLARTPMSGGLFLKGDLVAYSDRVKNDFPYHIEAKNGYDFCIDKVIKERKFFLNFVEQATSDCPKNRIPVIVASEKYKEDYVIFIKTHFPYKIDMNIYNRVIINLPKYVIILLDDLKYFTDLYNIKVVD